MTAPVVPCAILLSMAFVPAASARQSAGFGLPSEVIKSAGDQYDLATADFNGDGVFELVVAEQSNDVRIFWPDSHAHVVAQTVLPTGNGVDCVATGDVDGNGTADIVAVEWAPQDGARAMRVWLGDGAGGFTALPVQEGGIGDPWQIALADSTGDGKLDLIWGGAALFAGDGAGHFTLLSPYAYYGSGHGVAVGDFNEDRLADIAYGTGYVSPSGGVSVSDGLGGFTPSASFSMGGPAGAVVAADINGDGHLDLAWGVAYSQSQFQVTLGNGHGGFGAPIQSNIGFEVQELAAGDLDGDGVPEMISIDLGQPIAMVLKHIGGGKFTWISSVGLPNFADRPTLTDFDGDGDLDFACLDSFYNGVQITRQLEPAVFDTPRIYSVPYARFYGMTSADLNGDGVDDLVAANWNGTSITVIVTQPGGGSEIPKSYVSGIGPRAVALADLDEDGDLDAIVAHDMSTSLSFLPGNGNSATFGGPTLYWLNAKGVDVVVGDWNGDQHLDVAVGEQSPNGVAIFLGDGTGQLTPHATIASSGLVYSIVANDFNGDSILDLVVGGDSVALGTVYYGDGTGGFASGTALPVLPAAIADLVVADINGDGRNDLVVAHSGSTPIEVLESDGQGNFTPSTTGAYSGSPQSLLARDVDGDGDEDVFVLDAIDSSYGVLLGDPSGVLSAGGYFRAPVNQPVGFALGKFDTDGQIDVAIGATSNYAAIAIARSREVPGGVSTYCAAKMNSLHCTPSLGFLGLPSASAGSGFTITAQNVLNQKVGLFFYSSAGPNYAAFQGGTLCLKPPTHRCAPHLSGGNPPPTDCSGAYSIDFNAQIALGLDPNLVAGAAIYGQFWSRDPGFAAPNNTGLTNAIRFVIMP